jgi:regulator of nucleoside diphosphate kinase
MLAYKLPPDAACLADEWASLHRMAPFAVYDCELHYLSTTALSAADDLVAHLLLKKLKLATKLDHEPAMQVVRMNSFVEYDADESGPGAGRLIHPSAPVPGPPGIRISSLLGAGLIGLAEGQTILWPDEAGLFRPLTVIRTSSTPAGHRFSNIGKKLS